MKKLFICMVIFFTIYSTVKAQWLQTNEPYGGSVQVLAVSGTNLFAGIDDAGVFHSTNNGTNWTAVNSGLTNTSISCLAVGPNGIGEPNIFVGTIDGGIFRSSDNGTNWIEVNSGLTSMNVLCLAISPNGTGGANLFACNLRENIWRADIFLSTNNDTNWTQVNSESLYPFIDALAVIGPSLFVGAGWGGGLLRFTKDDTGWTVDTLITNNNSVNSLAVSGDSLVVGTSDGVFLFAENDTGWAAVNSGLRNKFILSLAVSGTHLFAGISSEGVFLSTNDNTSWTEVNSGLLPNTYVKEFAVSDSYVFAGTEGGSSGVWRRPLLEMIPVELTSFTASAIGKEVILNWSTATELNNYGFEIQRKALGGTSPPLHLLRDKEQQLKRMTIALQIKILMKANISIVSSKWTSEESMSTHK